MKRVVDGVCCARKVQVIGESTQWMNDINLGFLEVARGSLVETYRAMKEVQVYRQVNSNDVQKGDALMDCK